MQVAAGGEDFGRTRIAWSPQPKQARLISCPAQEIFFGGSRGGGKGQPLNADIVTPFGIRKMGELKVGSAVCAPDGTVSHVIGVYPLGERQIYRMRFHDGTSCEVTDDHIWLAWRMGMVKKQKGVKVGAEGSASLHLTSEIMASFIKGTTWLFPITGPVALTTTSRHELRPVDPYLLGVVLGDGSITFENIRISCAEPEIIERIEERTGYKLNGYHSDRKCSEYRLKEPSKERAYFKKVGLWGKDGSQKFIPKAYLLGTRDERIALLQGLMDTDGWADKDGDTYYCTVSERLRDDVVSLARSLGAMVTVRQKDSKDQNGNGVISYTLRIKHRTPAILFSLERKQAICAGKVPQSMNRRLVSIEPSRIAPAQCIKVSHPSGLYLTNDFIVTHNTDGVVGHFYSRAMKWGPQAKGLLLRRTLKGLLAVERRCKEVFGPVFPVKNHWHEQKKMWEFPNGATLVMNYCDTDDDVLQYQGHDYSFIYPEELTQWPLESTYQWLFTINRNPTVGKECQIVATGNPGGPGMDWVKKRFIDFGPADRIHTVEFKNPRDPDGPPLTRTRVFIPSSLHDNVYLQGSGYEAGLLSLPERMKLMYYDGRWDVVEGAFLDEWDPAVHICRAFNPPKEWSRWFSFDWGYDAPYGGLWWCQSPAGKIYIYREIYGVDPDGESNKGTREKAGQVAQKIRQIEAGLGEHITERWVDGSIYDGDGNDASIGQLFEKEGVFFQKARKTDKKGGVMMFRQMLQSINGVSQLQIMDNCRNLIRTLPLLQVDPHNPELYISKGGVEDHLADCCYMGARKNLPTPEESRMFKTSSVSKRNWGKGGWR